MMRQFALLSLFTLAAAAPDPEALFKEFEAKFSKAYATDMERATRLAIFTANLVELERVRLEDTSAEYSSLTPLMDWSKEEFAARNTLQADTSLLTTVQQADLLDVSDLPSDFDWVAKGAVNPVKNQKQCGSCWAFSVVGNIEGVNFVSNKQLLSLSEQELVDCDTKSGDQGCQGGLPSNAFKDMITNKLGLELESDYPYAAKNNKCTASQPKEKVFISNWTAVNSDEDQIAAALMKYGPLSIGINANPMQLYFGGVANPVLCDPKKLDHGVVIVGFGVDSGKKYWKIRNSWGDGWGEKGYYRIIRGVGKCGLNTMVTTAIMSNMTSAAQDTFVV